MHHGIGHPDQRTKPPPLPASDIWCWSLETCSKLFIWGPNPYPHPQITRIFNPVLTWSQWYRNQCHVENEFPVFRYLHVCFLGKKVQIASRRFTWIRFILYANQSPQEPTGGHIDWQRRRKHSLHLSKVSRISGPDAVCRLIRCCLPRVSLHINKNI